MNEPAGRIGARARQAIVWGFSDRLVRLVPCLLERFTFGCARKFCDVAGLSAIL
jgi:hypothetical protein